LKEFYALLDSMKETMKSLSFIQLKKGEYKSLRLKRLLSHEGLLPNMDQELCEFFAAIQWSQNGNGDKFPEPVTGFDSVYDEAKRAVDKVVESLNYHLKDLKKRLGYPNAREIRFIHCKEPYEVEVPEELVRGKHKPAEFELVS